MKKIIKKLKSRAIPHTITNTPDIQPGSLIKEIFVETKKSHVVIQSGGITKGKIEVSIEVPRSSNPYRFQACKDEKKAISYLHSQGII
jgi:hypothetical protein